MDVLYFVLVGRREYMRIYEVTDDAKRAREMAEKIRGVAVGFPISYSIADFRGQVDE